jgi:prefoldin subunit 5
MTQATTDAIQILEDTLSDLNNPKVTVAAAVRKLARSAGLCSEYATEIWCKIQLGDRKYAHPLHRYLTARQNAAKHRELLERLKREGKTASKEEIDAARAAEIQFTTWDEKLTGLGIQEEHRTAEELGFKASLASGGYESIEFIEQRIKDIERKKNMNDGTHYLTRLTSHAAFVRQIAHERESCRATQETQIY